MCTLKWWLNYLDEYAVYHLADELSKDNLQELMIKGLKHNIKHFQKSH